MEVADQVEEGVQGDRVIQAVLRATDQKLLQELDGSKPAPQIQIGDEYEVFGCDLSLGLVFEDVWL